MSITDGIMAALFVGTASYWITASVKLFKNTRRARVKRDPESAEIWRRLEAAQTRACCKAVRMARDEWDIAWLDVSFEKRTVQRVQLNYCPECGKKL
jgi:hypothetical protein